MTTLSVEELIAAAQNLSARDKERLVMNMMPEVSAFTNLDTEEIPDHFLAETENTYVLIVSKDAQKRFTYMKDGREVPYARPMHGNGLSARRYGGLANARLRRDRIGVSFAMSVETDFFTE